MAWRPIPSVSTSAQLFVAQLCGSVQLARGDSEQRSQAAVDVDAKCLVILAAVGVAARTNNTSGN